MGTRKGRHIAIATVLAVIAIAGTLVWLSRDHIRFFLAFENLGRNAQGYAEYRHRQTGIVFVSLPGGTFLMGSPDDEVGRNDDEGPVHEVTLSPFMISKYEVTQAQWEGVTQSRPFMFQGSELPVDSVSWADCREFYESTGLSLPTEAQWEYACRAGSAGRYPAPSRLDSIGWYNENSSDRTHPCGEKEPNGFGLHDMIGNVQEWCMDEYDASFYSRSESTLQNPFRPPDGSSRVLRGGCFGDGVESCRAADRYWDSPWNPVPSAGFRPVVLASP